MAADHAAAEEELVWREIMVRPAEAYPRFLVAQIAKGRGSGDRGQMIRFPGNVCKLADAFELSHRLTEEVFIFYHEHLRAIWIVHPGIDMLRPVARIKFGLGSDEFQEVVSHAMDCLLIVAIRDHCIAPIAQQVNDPAIFRAREGVRLEEHRRRVATIIFVVGDVGHEIKHEQAWRPTGIDPVNNAGNEILKPRVARLWVADNEDVFGKELRDRNESFGR